MGLSQGRWRKSYALVPGACKLRNLEGPASPSPVGPDVGETWSGLGLRPASLWQVLVGRPHSPPLAGSGGSGLRAMVAPARCGGPGIWTGGR